MVSLLCAPPCLLQVPLQVRLSQVTISHNVVQSGLCWLRLVNSTLQDVTISHNVGTGNRPRSARGAGGLHAPGGAAASARNASDAGNAVLPPGPCDVGALQRSLLIVHGPSAFDMDR